jgi:hypothetical protein
LPIQIKEKYIIKSVKKIVIHLSKLTLAGTIFAGSFLPSLPSSPATVDAYFKQNNYNLPSIYQLYLNPLNENGLDENEKRAIDLIVNTPEEKQDDGKALAKEIYDNKGLTSDILIKLENLNLPSEEQEPENPVDIYAVIANGADDKTEDGKFYGGNITSVLQFYQLMKDAGVSDANITLFLYHPNTEDIINTKAKKWLEYYFGPTSLPYSESEVSIDEEKVTLSKVLNAISAIPSDDNDLVYIMLSSHTDPGSTVRFPHGRLSYQRLRKAIKKIDNYGKIFVILESCYAGGFLKPLDRLRNYIGIGSCPKKEKCQAGILPFMLIKYKGKSIDDLVELGNMEIKNSKIDKSATLLSFYSDKTFGNEPLIPVNYLVK